MSRQLSITLPSHSPLPASEIKRLLKTLAQEHEIYSGFQKEIPSPGLLLAYLLSERYEELSTLIKEMQNE